VARAEAYLHAKFHLDPPGTDPSNGLATVHERYRETDRLWIKTKHRQPKYVLLVRAKNAAKLHVLHDRVHGVSE